ncbi:hypothetical protein HDK77DRAFT_463100 [Phyllosticta capitalensis]
MAYVLSVPSHSPLKRSFSETPYLRSPSPLSHDSSNTVRRCKPSNVSATSLISFASAQNGSWLKPNENTPPNVASRSLLDLINELSACPSLQSSLECVPEKISWVSNIPLPPSPDPRRTSFEQATLSIHVDRPTEKCPSPVPTFHEDPNSPLDEEQSPTDDHQDFFSSNSSILETPDEPTDELPAPRLEEDETEPKATPFKRWVSTLRRRNKNPAKGHKPRPEYPAVDDFPPELARIRTNNEGRSRHTKSSSLASSMAFVTAVKSASVTLASTSIAPLSRLGTRYSRAGRDDHRGSSFTDARSARESAYHSIIPVMDERAWERAKQRRRILEEIISSEEGYIGDLKVLSNIQVYLTVLASVPSVSPQTRMSIHRNVSQLVQLHEDLLGELHRIIPNSEYSQDDSAADHRPKPRHVRWHSIDGLPHRASALAAVNRRSTQRHSLDMCKSEEPAPVGVTADTETVAQVAKLFDQLMKRFFAYEEYSAQFESVNSELEASHRAIPAWQTYERGIEALSSMLVSANKKDANCRKGLTLADLMIKPIQRTSKYPLFFADLMKHTPVADDPVAHAELEKVHFRLKDANQEINNAKDDQLRRKLIETTWLLQDRLVFAQDQPIPRVVLTRLLGHVVLCGVLHVTYQTNDPRIHGKYMICMLFRSCLILAQTDKAYSSYNVFAMIALGNGSIERSDNGRGLQCHTAPFTWKLVFESSNRFHEVILSACSAEEEMVWKQTLRSHIAAENSDIVEGRSCMQDLFSSLSIDLRCLGASFGTPDSLTRKMALRRAATVGPKMHLQQVIIKNTQAQKRPEVTQSTSSLPVGRSHSTMTSTSLMPTLAPRRGERIRLETAIGDVWTKESIPYPGMGPRRAENPIRASANSVMRKLSMASIASNFSKRSGSYNSLSQLRKDDPWRSKRRSPSGSLSQSASPAPPCIKVDFHNAPDQFLPADFELLRRKLSMPTMPSSPLLVNARDRPATAAGPREAPKLDTSIKLPQSSEKDKSALSSLQSSPAGTPSRKRSINIKPRARLFKFWSHRNEAPKGVLASFRANATPSRSPSRRV